MDRRGENVADEQVADDLAPAAKRAEDAVPKPGPEEGDAGRLKPPEGGALTRKSLLDEEAIGEGVKVEAGEAENNVVKLVLVRHKESGCRIEPLGMIVVGREDAREEHGVYGEERHVLYVGVVLDVAGRSQTRCSAFAQETSQFGNALGYEVMDVMTLEVHHGANVNRRSNL